MVQSARSQARLRPLEKNLAEAYDETAVSTAAASPDCSHKHFTHAANDERISNRLQEMPFCVLLEIALQLCGWLAAYAGSALTSEKDLKFRNLDGRASLFHPILAEPQTLTVRSRMAKVSSAGDMIIEQFEMQVLDREAVCYAGDTTFGFFSDLSGH